MARILFLCLVFVINVLSASSIFQLDDDMDDVYIKERYRRSNRQEKIGQKIRSSVRKKDNTKDLILVNENGTEYKNLSRWYDNDSEKENNMTIRINEINDHRYYRSNFTESGEEYFIDLSNNETKKRFDQFVIEEHSKLSNSYKKAYRVHLKFEFPYYGNMVDNVVVTTGGFINIGPVYHSYIHKVHYVAPLMCDFDPTGSNDTKVYIGSNNELFIVQWTDILLSYDNKNKFTFQAQLHKNGTIVMAYKNIPMSPIDIRNTSTLNVTVGLSDGYVFTFKRIIPFLWKVINHRYIYTHHKINFSLSKVKRNSAIKFDLLPNCVQFHTCESCINSPNFNYTLFQCKWCPAIQRCSDSFDWYRQSWLVANCQVTGLKVKDKCSAIVPPTTKKSLDHNTKKNSDRFKPRLSPILKKKLDNESSTKGPLVGGLIGVLLLILIVCIASFFAYAYLHPQSRSGMWLIEHRPGRMFQKTFDKVPEEELL